MTNLQYEEKLILDYIDMGLQNFKTKLNRKIEDNPILLISEVQNKVLLPYLGEEVESFLKNENSTYNTEQDFIEKKFTRNLDDFKNPFSSRFKEAYDLVTKRDNYSKFDGIRLGIELFGKKYLHPAIIAACRNTDELDVYLDCLEKNELSDFKIFEIKYEVYPVAVKNSNYKEKIKNTQMTKISTNI